MKALPRKWLLLAAALTLAPATYAQTATRAESAARQQRTYAQGLLWKVESASGQTSHVFGTIHLSDARVLALPGPVKQSFDGSGSFVMEVTLDPANLMQLAGRMIFTDGRDLQGVLGPALFQKVAATAPSIGLPPEMLRYLKPWAVALILMVPQTNGDNVLDDRLYKMAIEQNKGVHQLETVDEQVDMFDGMAENEQIAMLRNAVDNRERLPKLMERMVDTYLKRDLAALYRISEEDDGLDPALQRMKTVLMQRLLDERNIRMADRADVLLKNGRAFIAVGALHLYGERGVLALLANRGYRVTRLY
ncbi:MAG TPA: TraB/GumN family protein [Burkholderiales bacterium]